LLSECVDVFARIIAPHRVTVHRIIESGEGPIEVGKNFAKRGLWKEAEEAWAEAARAEPANATAYYNLGLAYEVQGKLDEAEASYKKAASLKQKSLYLEALANCRRAKQEQEKLQKQLEQREL